jgi:hypothetical protein
LRRLPDDLLAQPHFIGQRQLAARPHRSPALFLPGKRLFAFSPRYPHLDDLVTTRELSTSELKLIKEIELVRGELKETELRLVKEIEAVRAETEKVRAELKVDIARSHAGLLK